MPELKFRCPFHDQHTNGDADPSARWNEAKQVWYCDVCRKGGGATSLPPGWLNGAQEATEKPTEAQEATPVATRQVAALYDYRSAPGELLFQVIRYEPKGFSQRRPDGTPGLGDTPRVLYRLPELVNAPHEPVFLVEGEKDADALATLGLIATTNPGGAGNWKPDYGQWLRDRHVVILPDNDEAGRKHAEVVKRAIGPLVSSLRIVALPGVAEKGDVSDWLAAGGTGEALLSLARSTPAERLPKWTDVATRNAPNIAPTRWVVDHLLPAGGLSLLIAKPKVGKSVLSRCIACSVGNGTPILGRATRQSRVLLVSREDGPEIAETHFAQLGGSERVLLWYEAIPSDPLRWLEQAIREHQAQLVVLDTLGRFFVGQLRDLNNYVEFTRISEPLIGLARSTGAHILATHHAPKSAQGSDITDLALGSTAVSGTVDTILAIKRRGDIRTIASVQRRGRDLKETILRLDASGWQHADETWAHYCARQSVPDLLSLLSSGPLDFETIAHALQLRNRGLVRQVLNIATRDGQVKQTGTGHKGDPFLYHLVPKA